MKFERPCSMKAPSTQPRSEMVENRKRYRPCRIAGSLPDVDLLSDGGLFRLLSNCVENVTNGIAHCKLAPKHQKNRFQVRVGIASGTPVIRIRHKSATVPTLARTSTEILPRNAA